MALKTPVLTSGAPAPLLGIFSQAIVANGFVFVSGATPTDPATGTLIDGDVATHTVQLQSSLLGKHTF
jgi:enamine deaminase RidA (YjgF/YER057c/UK114 family)